jgi:hypothetical protein
VRLGLLGIQQGAAVRNRAAGNSSREILELGSSSYLPTDVQPRSAISKDKTGDKSGGLWRKWKRTQEAGYAIISLFRSWAIIVAGEGYTYIFPVQLT